jgi:hypothetical protein
MLSALELHNMQFPGDTVKQVTRGSPSSADIHCDVE